MDPDYRAKALDLVAAAAKGNADLVRAAIDAGADIHFEQDLPLRSAAFTGQLECMKILVAAGADVGAQFHEALYAAAKAGDAAMVDFLLDNGGDTDIVMKFHDKKLDTASRDMLLGRGLRDSFEKAKQHQTVIDDIADSVHRQGLKFTPRPPAP